MQLSLLHKNILNSLIKESTVELSKIRHELSHAINTLEWLYKLENNPRVSLQAAALLHDSDRFIEKEKARQENFSNYKNYKRAHSQKAALVATKILDKLGLKDLAREVAGLVSDHEFGSNPNSQLISDADSLAFFDKNLIPYFHERGEKITKKKIIFMYNRLSDRAKRLLDESYLEFKKFDKLNEIFMLVSNSN